MVFELRALPLPEEQEACYSFLFFEDRLLVEVQDEHLHIPFQKDFMSYDVKLQSKIYLGRLDSHPCYVNELCSDKLPEHTKLIGLRQLFGLVEDELFWLAARAYHLMNWNRNNQYCGRCGSQVHYKALEHAKSCPSCHLTLYPKISPAVIVAVTKENKILLAKNAQSKLGFYSVLAGFVEPGENLEECVKREIQEEAGIQVHNIHYFGSQPWPFPDSLMVGFTAEYLSGELIIDKKELIDADWFTVDNMPDIPGSISISRRLINNFLEKNS